MEAVGGWKGGLVGVVYIYISLLTLSPKYLIIHQRRKRKVIKQVRKVLPNTRSPVLPQALIVKSVNLRDLAGLVVSSEDEDPVGVTNLEGDEESHGLDGVVAAVDVVAHEEVVGVGGGTANAVQLDQVVPLAVHVPTYSNRASDGLGGERRVKRAMLELGVEWIGVFVPSNPASTESTGRIGALSLRSSSPLTCTLLSLISTSLAFATSNFTSASKSGVPVVSLPSQPSRVE